MNKATEEVADLIDLLFVRAVLLLVVGAACLFGYRFAVARFLSKAG